MLFLLPPIWCGGDVAGIRGGVKIKEGETTDAKEQEKFREGVGGGGYNDDDEIECLLKNLD